MKVNLNTFQEDRLWHLEMGVERVLECRFIMLIALVEVSNQLPIHHFLLLLVSLEDGATHILTHLDSLLDRCQMVLVDQL